MVKFIEPRTTGSDEYVSDPVSYYPWRGISEKVTLDFEGGASGSTVVDMTGEWYADKRLGFSTNVTPNESGNAGYISGLAWGHTTRVKFVRDGVVYTARISEIDVKPRDVRSYGFDCPAKHSNSSMNRCLIQVRNLSESGSGDFPVKKYRDGRKIGLVHQNEIVGVKADYIDGNKCVFDNEGVHTVSISR